MKILSDLDINNLHHAYLIEGTEEIVLPEVLEFIENLGIKTTGNPDFFCVSTDFFKIADARNLKSMTLEKSFKEVKRFFVISTNSFLNDAQNTLLKIFEEPKENTHYFLILPDANILIPTLLSRFYLIKSKIDLESELKDAEKFVADSLRDRIEFIKNLLAEEKIDEEDEEEVTASKNSTRSKAIKFLNALELVLYNKYCRDTKLNQDKKIDFFKQIFKVREYLRQPGSSMKSLMESVALVVPIL